MMRSILTVFVYLIVLQVQAQQLPEPMVPYRLVNDFTGLLSEQEQITLNNKLLQFNNETSTQIYVVTYDDLQGFDIADFGDRLGEKWGIGQKGKDNGILVLVSPGARKITIRTGYGLEGAVPDAIAKRLISNVIMPHFRQANYYAGLDSTAGVLMSLTRGEFTADDYMKSSSGKSAGMILLGFFLVMLALIVLTSAIRRNRYYSPRHTIPWWILLGSGATRDSDWGSFTTGRGRFGGGSGGGFGGGFGRGFGGGGGGSFGGGGASGGW